MALQGKLHHQDNMSSNISELWQCSLMGTGFLLIGVEIQALAIYI